MALDEAKFVLSSMGELRHYQSEVNLILSLSCGRGIIVRIMGVTQTMA